MKKKYDQTNVPEDNAPEKEVKKGKKIANIIINVILVIAIIIAAVATYVSFVSTSGNGVPSIFGRSILSIQTESMYPTLEPGDLIIDKAVKDTKTLKVGDIITYWTVIDGERVLNTHRIFQIYDGGNYLIFATKGDNNTNEDPLTVHESEVVGLYSTKEGDKDVGGTRIKGAGKVFDFLQTSTGFLVVVVIPVAIFFLFHLVQFFRVLFEYQNVKNRLRYEQERGTAEDMLDEEKQKFEETKKAEREKLESELRERLKKELLESNAPAEKSAEEIAAEEAAKAAAEREKMEAELRAKIMAELAAQKNEEPAEAPTENGEDAPKAE
ncbi:MAG: signal peptidase I [Clostridia bacterium]|nr:signal peptidase I [Clostridia bacterium]